jgi:hypothetical protein
LNATDSKILAKFRNLRSGAAAQPGARGARGAPAPVIPLLKKETEKQAAPAAEKAERAGGWRAWLTRARRMIAPKLLLLVWDVDRLSAAAAWRQGRTWHFSAIASSRLTDFGPALDEALARLRAEGVRPPRRCFVAARFIVPARVDIPVPPEKPRPFRQMREMARAEMEPAVAEAGALWTIGAVLAARGLIDEEARARVVLELALRRGQSSVPTYFGQVACELGLVGKEDVQEALRLQEKLQTLEAVLACGWTGYAGEPGEPPVWLASATGMALWQQFETACKRRGRKILGALPLVWSMSESAGDARAREAGNFQELDDRREEARESSRIALEIHAEEVVAVLRHRGRIVSARVEGRMERALAADWLLRLVADWRAGGVNALEIVCLAARDEAQVKALLEDIGLRWGRPAQLREAAAARRAVFECLALQYRARIVPLPLIRFGEPPRPPWTRAGFWHLCLPLLVVAIAAGLDIRQRMEIAAIKKRFVLAEVESQRRASVSQQEANALLAAQRERAELEAARQRAAQLMPEVERLQTIESMTDHLPQLLRTLAVTISDDVVLEVVRNARQGGDIGNVMVVGWTINYSSAQAFALRVHEALAAAGLGYAVAQTDVRAGIGREGKPGYFVSFWLVPRTPADELGLEEGGRGAEAASPAANSTNAAGDRQ